MVILQYQDNRWDYQMYYVAIAYYCLAVLVFAYFVSSPADKGFQM